MGIMRKVHGRCAVRRSLLLAMYHLILPANLVAGLPTILLLLLVALSLAVVYSTLPTMITLYSSLCILHTRSLRLSRPSS